jgi:hypothetical protein
MELPTLAVLDHWVNYRARFVRAGVEVLPDAFVVVDREAAGVAAAEFGTSRPILTWRNRYLENEAQHIQAIGKRSPSSPPERLLVALEPVRDSWTIDGESMSGETAEAHAFDYLMQNLHHLAPLERLTVRLRPHPSQAASKYESWLRRRPGTRIELSSGSTLAEDIAWADAVAGLQSYALIVALAAHRRAVTYLPPGAPSCPLPHAGVERIVPWPESSK